LDPPADCSHGSSGSAQGSYLSPNCN